MSAAAAAGAMAIIGSGMQIGSTFFGKGDRVEIPDYVPVGITDAQGRAVEGNLKALPNAKNLAGSINLFNQDQILQMLRASIPGYDAMMTQGGKNINAMLRGELPEDVSRSVWDSSAARALGRGIGRSQIGRNLGLRDLGLVSLQRTDQGLDAANRWIQMAKATATPGLFDFSGSFLTAAQRINMEEDQNRFAWNVNLQRAVQKSLPRPEEAALSDWMNQTGGAMAGMGLQGLAGGGFSMSGGGGRGLGSGGSVAGNSGSWGAYH